jgi:hypothetical protein
MALVRFTARHTAQVLTAASVLAAAFADDAVARRIISPEFDSRQQLRLGGNDVSVTGPLTCEAGNAWRIDVTVNQGSAAGRARTAGNCSGTGQEWRARVAVDGDAVFTPGAASGCGHLVATDPGGRVSQDRRWCSDFTLVSEAAPVAGAGDEAEEDSDTLTVVAIVLGALALVFAAATALLVRRRSA